ncbi:hypothetical protein COOONC_09047 [Cooperia oncophora]
MCESIEREADCIGLKTRTKVMYKLDDSPSHFKQPALYLRQLRQNGDYRHCDVELLTDAGSENVHSAVAAGHCKKIAKVGVYRSMRFTPRLNRLLNNSFSHVECPSSFQIDVRRNKCARS